MIIKYANIERSKSITAGCHTLTPRVIDSNKGLRGEPWCIANRLIGQPDPSRGVQCYGPTNSGSTVSTIVVNYVDHFGM